MHTFIVLHLMTVYVAPLVALISASVTSPQKQKGLQFKIVR